MDIPPSGIRDEADVVCKLVVDEVVEMLLRVAARRLLEDVVEESTEDSTALACAIETFAFALAKLVTQTLI